MIYLFVHSKFLLLYKFFYTQIMRFDQIISTYIPYIIPIYFLRYWILRVVSVTNSPLCNISDLSPNLASGTLQEQDTYGIIKLKTSIFSQSHQELKGFPA